MTRISPKTQRVPRRGIFDAFMHLAEALEAIFDRNVDLVTERSIRSPYSRKVVDKSRVRIYDRRKLASSCLMSGKLGEQFKTLFKA